MRYFMLFVALCITPSIGVAAEAPTLSPAAQEILKVRKARLDASGRKDAAAWGRYVADGFVGTDDGGILRTKAQIMEGFKKEDKSLMINTTGDPEQFQVHLFGDTAVANFRLKWDDNFDGQHHSAYSRMTEVYQRQRGKWLLISRQETDVPYSLTPAAPAHPELYADYVGDYRVGPQLVINVTRSGDKLFEQWPGDDSPLELLPLSENWYFVRDDAGSIEFVRDKSGTVIAHRYRDVAGDIIGERIR
jgi:ketosteroid isomerase-like protein